MSVIALITAGGRGSRFAKHDIPKQYLPLCGMPILRHCINTFLSHNEVDNVVVVIRKEDLELYKEATFGLDILPAVYGGKTRQESVRFGLESLQTANPKKVLIHDAARPFVTKKIISSVITQLDYSSAVIPAVQIDDTIKKCSDGKILWTVERSDLWRAQTPQGFNYQDIMHYHKLYKDKIFTDDAALKEHAGMPVTIIPGSPNNFKITTDDDYERAEAIAAQQISKATKENRVGLGFDIHAFNTTHNPNGTIMLGGVEIPHEFSLIGHSDGDVLLHSVIDALLGAVGLDDIGTYFPDTDEKWKGADSSKLLKYVHVLLKNKNARVINLDINIICEYPKIAPHRKALVASIARILGLDVSRINIKGKTFEKLGAIGRREGIACQAVAMIEIDIIEE